MVALRVRPEPSPVMIRFDAAHRAEDATHVRLADFDGPLALLLALIEQQRLDVLTVRLGDLAGAFLDALAQLDARRLPLLSSFVSVSAQLILIKSRAVLPRPAEAGAERETTPDEGADPEAELRARLIVYRQFRDAGQAISARGESGAAMFHREPTAALAAAHAGARAPAAPALDPAVLRDALAGVVRLAPPAAPPPEVLPRTITLEERAAIVRRALDRAPTIVLQDLLRDVHDRVVVAVTFMALLEMVKGREVDIEQAEPWGPISVRAVASGR